MSRVWTDNLKTAEVDLEITIDTLNTTLVLAWALQSYHCQTIAPAICLQSFSSNLNFKPSLLKISILLLLGRVWNNWQYQKMLGLTLKNELESEVWARAALFMVLKGKALQGQKRQDRVISWASKGDSLITLGLILIATYHQLT
jgi:hypothetical protein